MNNLSLAFLMGLFGSLHCAVMCGPLMLSMPIQKYSLLKSAAQLFLYQMGRVMVYTLLGLIAGYLGSNFRLFTNQETLSLVIGCLLVAFTLLHFTGRYLKYFERLQALMVYPIGKLMGKIYGLPFWGLFAGALNGLIPCGMVYLALASALNSASIKDGAFFMALFGIGTTPLMLMISLGGIYLKKYVRFNSNKLIPWFMLFLGTLFILRSADLGIPFLSPSAHYHPNGEVTSCE